MVGSSLVGLGIMGTLVTLLSDLAHRGWHKRERAQQAVPTRIGRSEYDAQTLPPISVLRPVKGDEVGLRENFEALLQQRYPEFEVLVGAEDANDPALGVARDVAARTGVPMRVITCPGQTGLNPKVSILERLSREARYDAVLVSDSNVRVRRGYLENLGARLAQPGVGLVTNIVLGESPGTLAALCEVLQLTTFVARGTLFARVFLSHACVVGKSMLFRMSDLNSLGGFPRVRNVLAEDYVIGHIFSKAGFQVALSPDPVPVPLPCWSLRQLWNRHLRWAQMRRRVSLGAYLLEPLLYPTLPLVAGIILCLVLGDQRATAMCGMSALVVRCVLDARLLMTAHTRRAAPWFLASPLKDTLMLAIWGVALFKRTLMWRGNQLIIGAGSRLERAYRENPFVGDVAETMP